MTEAKTKSVNMTFPALFSYVLNTNYRSMSGILGLVLSFGAIVMLVIGWNTTSGRQKGTIPASSAAASCGRMSVASTAYCSSSVTSSEADEANGSCMLSTA